MKTPPEEHEHFCKEHNRSAYLCSHIPAPSGEEHEQDDKLVSYCRCNHHRDDHLDGLACSFCNCYYFHPSFTPSGEWEKRFDEKRRSIDDANFYGANDDSEVTEFGYKTKRPSSDESSVEVFTITDWGNIKSFIRTELTKAKADTKAECVRKIEILREGPMYFGQGGNGALTAAIHSLQE